jgi:C-terminal processing protease CtpA/Prc/membrane protease YdiL (CAAX protease family)
MKDESSAAFKRGFPAIRWAISGSLAIVIAGLLGYAFAWPLFYLLSAIAVLKPYMPSIAEVLFTLGPTGAPVLLSYLYFTGRTGFVTGWSQKLPHFFHLDSHLPGFPAVLGLNYRAQGVTGKRIILFAVAGVALTYGFDYFNGDLVAAGPQLVGGDAPAASGQSAQQALTMMSGVNLVISALVMAFLAAFAEEVLFRGVLLNLWKTAFATEAATLDGEPGRLNGLLHRVFVYGGSTFAVVISAALFAIPHMDGIVSQLFFGLIAAFIYLQTRTIWTPVLMHVINNSILPVLILVSFLSGGAAGGVHSHDAVNVAPGTVRSVTQADINRDDFNASGNIFLQICEPQTCASQLTILENLAKQFPKVTVYQADKTKVPELSARLDQEMAIAAKDKASTAAPSYPVYIYANSSLQVAPPAAKDEGDLSKFIEQNFTVYDEDSKGQNSATAGQSAAGPGVEAARGFVSKFCNADNKGPFDGKAQYACVYDTLVNTDLALRDSTRRRAFVTKNEHRFDNDPLLKDQAGTAKAIQAMINDLGEIHTAFFTPERYTEVKADMEASLIGIGAPLTRLNYAGKSRALGENPSLEAVQALQKITEDTPAVIFPAPDEGTPAAKAGLQAGDQIVAVDGRPSIGRTLNELAADIRGKNAGDTLQMTVKRAKGAAFEELTVPVTRARVIAREVTLQMLDKGYAALKVRIFGNHVSKEFTEGAYKACTGKTLPADDKEMLALMRTYRPEVDCQLKGLAIDERSNPGGRLDQVTEMLQAVMKEGPIVSTLTRNGNDVIEVRDLVTATSYRKEVVVDGKQVDAREMPRMWRILPEGLPIVVLVDSGSASASEILAGSLQGNGLATVIGAPSFGKQVGQSEIEVDFGAGLRITTFRFMPGGRELGVAVLPDFPVEDNIAYIDNPLTQPDAVLQKAVEVLDMGRAALDVSKSPENIAAKADLAAKAAKDHELRNQKIVASQTKSAS